MRATAGTEAREQLYQYVLRCAYLQYILDPEYSRTRVQNSPARPNVGEVLGSDAQAEVSLRFSKDVIKNLRTSLEQISMGRNKEYDEQLLRATFGVFYSYLVEPNTWKQAKEGRKLEGLILMFVSRSTGELRKRKIEDSSLLVNSFTAKFCRLLRTLISRHEPAGRTKNDLIARLERYEDKLGTENEVVANEIKAPLQVQKMRLVCIVGKIFKKPDVLLQRDVDNLRDVVTPKRGIQDLRQLHAQVEADAVLCEDDFDDPGSFYLWKTQEQQALTQLAKSIAVSYPELSQFSSFDSTASKPISRANSIGSTSSSQRKSASSVRNGSTTPNTQTENSVQLTFVPEDPIESYRLLLAAALENLFENGCSLEDVHTLASPLMNECCMRWRVRRSTRAAEILGLMKNKFLDDEIGLDVLRDSLLRAHKMCKDLPSSQWPHIDRGSYQASLKTLSESLLRDLYQILTTIFDDSGQNPGPCLEFLENVLYQDPLHSLDTKEFQRHISQFQQGIEDHALESYARQWSVLSESCKDIYSVLEAKEAILKSLKRTTSRFKYPLFECVDVSKTCRTIYIRKLLGDMAETFDDMLALDRPKEELPDFEAVLSLHNEYKELIDTGSNLCQGLPDSDAQELVQDLKHYFGFIRLRTFPFLEQWLSGIETKVMEWVTRALEKDKFVADDAKESHSSSVVDLFQSIQQSYEVIESLGWPMCFQQARAATHFSRIIWRVIGQYGLELEKLYSTEMMPVPVVKTVTTQERLLNMAREAVIKSERVEPFYFNATSCVKINNVQFAKEHLDHLENQLQAPQVSKLLKQENPESPVSSKAQAFFNVKLLEAENLRPRGIGGSCNPYAVISAEKGQRIGKTATVKKDLNPRWNETFEISTSGLLLLTVTVWDRDWMGEHHVCGRCHLKLDPKIFADYLPRELCLDLDTQGKLLFRITMEGEKDDALFYFGRSHRSLERAEEDMIQVVVAKMRPYIGQSISRQTLHSLAGIPLLDVGKTINSVSSLLGRTGISMRQRTSSAEMRQSLTDRECEDAIAPLMDYFDNNFSTLDSNLSPDAFLRVMTLVWHEVLSCIEALFVPPLSDEASSMKPLDEVEIEVVYKWLNFFKNYFHANGDGVPQSVLHSLKHNQIISLRHVYQVDTETLKQHFENIMQAELIHVSRKPVPANELASSIYRQGTIRTHGRSKSTALANASDGDMILRVLRMRPGAEPFLQETFRQRRRLSAQAEAEAGLNDFRKRRL